ncbi:D-alanyl-lipoteichoic acid biosynthesis protein DltB [Oscillospiraceae bacterium HV4-5-C5C]|nr:D-alanyl-lipoteichoic acid biosynthesis protein DltB [Oscillospiraceae bacterium HV4-5-C5C]
MSFFSGLDFYLLLIPFLAVAVLIGRHKSLKAYNLLISLLFITLIYGSSKAQALSLLLYLIYEFILLRLYLYWRTRQGRKQVRYRLMLFLALLPLAAVKLTLPQPLSLFGFLGISYASFKVLQILIDSYDGLIKQLSFYDYASFILFFPTLSSGPIDRSERYLADLAEVKDRETYMQLVYQGLWKFLLGLVYKLTFSEFFYVRMQALESTYTPAALLAYAYLYGFYLFFDFAGYSLMAVGCSYILGVKTPDNFRFPFISRDMKEFWDRWHITLSHWLRDYLFSRFMFQSIKKKRFKSRLTGASVGFMLNMTVMGFWHGLSGQYIIYGLYHGVLLALTEIYQKKSGFYKRHQQQRWYQGLSWLLTLNLVMFGFMIFSGHLNPIPAALWRRLVS